MSSAATTNRRGTVGMTAPPPARDCTGEPHSHAWTLRSSSGRHTAGCSPASTKCVVARTRLRVALGAPAPQRSDVVRLARGRRHERRLRFTSLRATAPDTPPQMLVYIDNDVYSTIVRQRQTPE